MPPTPDAAYRDEVNTTAAVTNGLGRAVAARPWLADGMLAAAIAVGQVAFVANAAHGQSGTRALDGLGYALLALNALPLVARRRWPVAAFLACLAVSGAYHALGFPEGPADIGTLIALYTLASRAPSWVSVLAFMVTLVVVVNADEAARDAEPRVMEFLLETGFPGLVVLGFGYSVRGRRQLLAAAEERAAAAERTREAEARRRVEEERLRIARDLHDVLAHSVSTINVQAGVAAHLLDQQPEQARSALLAIREQSKQALRELRATLGVLRQPGEPAAPRQPAPGLHQLEALVDSMRQAGLPVEVQVEGAPAQLPSAVDLVAYRIVQESLTNVLRHAAAARATVHLSHRRDALVIEVDDDGPALVDAPPAAVTPAGAKAWSAPPALHGRPSLGTDQAGEDRRPEAGGHGIVGMRERARAVGGELEAGPRPDGGFRVTACLPVGS
jgi:signal transduction histidine kinase